MMKKGGGGGGVALIESHPAVALWVQSSPWY